MRSTGLSARLVLVPAMCAVLCVPAGCALVAVGAVGAAGGVTYQEGRERRLFSVNMDTAWDAMHAAVKERNIQITSEKRTPGSGEIVGRWGEKGQSVRIFAKFLGSGSTVIGSRVGVADQSGNLEVMRYIEYNMPPGTPPSVDYDK
jgi:hypothetical protein